MTAEEFRQLALSLPEATEQSHMGHPDFRVRGRIFATLGYPDGIRVMAWRNTAPKTLVKLHASPWSER